MSKINGQKARAAIMKKRRTARRVKDRARLAAIKAGQNSTGGSTQKSGAARS